VGSCSQLKGVTGVLRCGMTLPAVNNVVPLPIVVPEPFLTLHWEAVMSYQKYMDLFKELMTRLSLTGWTKEYQVRQLYDIRFAINYGSCTLNSTQTVCKLGGFMSYINSETKIPAWTCAFTLHEDGKMTFHAPTYQAEQLKLYLDAPYQSYCSSADYHDILREQLLHDAPRALRSLVESLDAPKVAETVCEVAMPPVVAVETEWSL
jgi:hypothetical protein